MNEETLFHLVLGKAPSEREAFLKDACGGDEVLRQRVEARLHAHENLGTGSLPARATTPEEGNVDRGADTTDEPPLVDKPALVVGPGSFVGPYKLLQKLGEGGMGTVYVAEQEHPVKRSVALKIIKAGMDSAHVIARFEQERQALALMDHPNIARVLDAGTTENGLPYFVMELVKGIPITKFCDQELLTPRERLELFIPVCQAVQHAHQKGIIHRDLKPSNVLIALYDGKPVPKVIDFGIAKATSQKLTEGTVFTEVGQIVGTLEYMAPEQAEPNNLDIDTRADSYALGVVLYELLTGSPPFASTQLRSAAFNEMLRLIREVEPPKPSTKLSGSDELPSIAAKRKLEPKRLTRLVQGDLDWIIMKCLEKERARRYETANGLALDVLRYLQEEPVLAGPPSARYRLRKFVRRNRGPVLASAGFAVLVLLGIGGLIAGLVTLDAERRNTAEALSAETVAKTQARQALNILTDDVIENVFAKQQVLGETEKGFLRKVLESYEQFTQELGDTPDARALRASGYFRVAVIRNKLGQAAEAETAYLEAIAIRNQLVADFPTVTAYREELASSHTHLGVLLMHTGRPSESETAFCDALAINKQLVADFPTVSVYRQELATSHGNLGNVLNATGRPKEAETAYRDALAIQKQFVADFPSVPAYRQDLAKIHINLGGLLQNTGQPKEAEAAYRNALAIFEQLAADFPTVPVYLQELATSHSNLGLLLTATGRPKEAEKAYRDALAIQKQLAADFPTVPVNRQDLAVSHHGLGGLRYTMGRPKEAQTAYRDALAIRKQLVADFPTVTAYRQELAASHIGLGLALAVTGRPREAETAFRDSLAINKQLAVDFPTLPAYRQELAMSHNNLGNLLHAMDRPKEAETDYHKALAIHK
jgi:serine/threonine protein kinase/Tfp pilus assembly protein PilF